MSIKWGKPQKNKGKRRDPKWHSEEYQINEEEEKDFGSNQENIEKLKQSRVLKEAYGDFDTGSRTSYTDEETMAGIDDDRDPSFAELLSDTIMQGWEDTITSAIKEHMSDDEEKFLDERGVWVNLGNYDEEMMELVMRIRDNLLDTFDQEENLDEDYESQGYDRDVRDKESRKKLAKAQSERDKESRRRADKQRGYRKYSHGMEE